MTFSTITSEDLKQAGIQWKHLIFAPAKVSELTSELTTKVEVEIMDLHSQIKKIYAHVNMSCEPGYLMVLDTILLTLAEITLTKESGVVILPEMRITLAQEVHSGAHTPHPVSGYDLELSGNVDYAVVVYDDVKDYKNHMLSPGASREDAFNIVKGRLFLLDAKCQSLERSLISYIPEAVSQAIALLKSKSLPEVHFCLSDGQTWIFFILKLENGTLTC